MSGTLDAPAGELEFVRAHLPAPPARVLEVGCGGGALARILAADGHDVTAIDPEAPEGPIFRRERIEEHRGGPYDAVVAARSLHHVDDLDEALASSAGSGPLFVLAEFAWERFDKATAAWWERRREGLVDPHGPPAAGWFDRYDHLHSFEAMHAALGRHFVERKLEWTPYLSYLLHDPDESEERSAIERGEIAAIGFRYVGEARRR